MIVRLRICESVVDGMEQLMPGIGGLLTWAARDVRAANVFDYLATLDEMPHEAISRWCIDRLLALYDPQRQLREEAAGRVWAAERIVAAPGQELPTDLAWAVRSARSSREWPLHDELRLVHALSEPLVQLARQIQPSINRIAAQLVQLGCRPRQSPIIMGLPRTLDQELRDDQLTDQTGWCDLDHAVVTYDCVKSQAPYRDKVIAHEMIHSTQGWWVWRDQYSLLEGLTEKLTDLVEPGFATYRAERALVEQVIDRLGIDQKRLVALSNDPSDLLFDPQVRGLSARYALSRGARFVNVAMLQDIHWSVARDRDIATWACDPAATVRETALRLGMLDDRLGDGLRNESVRAAALLMWACHAMDEQASRVLRWIDRNDPEMRAELDAVVRWKADPLALQWLRQIERGGNHLDERFWASAARRAVIIDDARFDAAMHRIRMLSSTRQREAFADVSSCPGACR